MTVYDRAFLHSCENRAVIDRAYSKTNLPNVVLFKPAASSLVVRSADNSGSRAAYNWTDQTSSLNVAVD